MIFGPMVVGKPFTFEPGQVVFDSSIAGSRTFTVPENVTRISAVVVGHGGGNTGAGRKGGGGGGALSYSNDIEVTPGEVLDIFIPEFQPARIRRQSNLEVLVQAEMGRAAASSGGGLGGRASEGIGDVCFSGGQGGDTDQSDNEIGQGCGGGGAAGYAGVGGNGAGGNWTSTHIPATAGSGGGGGGGGRATGREDRYGASGGGVGLLGIGTSGAAGSSSSNAGGGGGGGSGGENGLGGANSLGDSAYDGVRFGSGAGGGWSYPVPRGIEGVKGGDGGPAGVRIMWGGNRSYPNNAGDV